MPNLCLNLLVETNFYKPSEFAVNKRGPLNGPHWHRFVIKNRFKSVVINPISSFNINLEMSEVRRESIVQINTFGYHRVGLDISRLY